MTGAGRELRAEVWLPLLQEALARHGRFTLPLAGNSMRPTLPEACEIDVAPAPAGLRLGQLIVFAAGDALVAHRFVRRRRGYLIAQGDNRRSPDSPLRAGQVLGVVTAARVAGRQVWPGRWERLLAGGWLVRYHALRGVRWAARRVRRGGMR